MLLSQSTRYESRKNRQSSSHFLDKIVTSSKYTQKYRCGEDSISTIEASFGRHRGEHGIVRGMTGFEVVMDVGFRSGLANYNLSGLVA